MITCSVSHAVKEDPVVASWAVLDKGDVVAGLDAKHCEQLQPVSAHRPAGLVSPASRGNVDRNSAVSSALTVVVHLGHVDDSNTK